jgi:hypothetical protein
MSVEEPSPVPPTLTTASSLRIGLSAAVVEIRPADV